MLPASSGDLILAIRGYNQCVATARSKDLTERLKQELATLVKREIATLAARIRHGPVEVTAVGSVVGEVVRHARHGPLGTAVVATLLAALKDRDESGRWLAVRSAGSGRTRRQRDGRGAAGGAQSR